MAQPIIAPGVEGLIRRSQEAKAGGPLEKFFEGTSKGFTSGVEIAQKRQDNGLKQKADFGKTVFDGLDKGLSPQEAIQYGRETTGYNGSVDNLQGAIQTVYGENQNEKKINSEKSQLDLENQKLSKTQKEVDLIEGKQEDIKDELFQIDLNKTLDAYEKEDDKKVAEKYIRELKAKYPTRSLNINRVFNDRGIQGEGELPSWLAE